jgi:DNA-binding protein YbaB
MQIQQMQQSFSYFFGCAGDGMVKIKFECQTTLASYRRPLEFSVFLPTQEMLADVIPKRHQRVWLMSKPKTG